MAMKRGYYKSMEEMSSLPPPSNDGRNIPRGRVMAHMPVVLFNDVVRVMDGTQLSMEQVVDLGVSLYFQEFPEVDLKDTNQFIEEVPSEVMPQHNVSLMIDRILCERLYTRAYSLEMTPGELVCYAARYMARRVPPDELVPRVAANMLREFE